MFPNLQEGQFVWVKIGREQYPAHFVKWEGTKEALVRWDNGQGEYVPHQDIATQLPPRRQRHLGGTSRNKRTVSGDIKTSSYTTSSSDSLCPALASSGERNSTERPKEPPALSSSPFSLDEDPVPDQPVSSSGLLKSMQQDILDVRVKQEGEQTLNSTQRQVKKEELQAKIKANMDPTGNPRFVFRKGCHPQCITTILGGKGTDECPTAQNVPNLGQEFIQPGEFYFAGVEEFNSFCPKYPGDSGFVDSNAFQKNPHQSIFHLFVQCSKQRFHTFWHGSNAKQGYLYVGMYKVGDRDVEPEMTFKLLDTEYKNGIADYYLSRPQRRWYEMWKDKQAYYTKLAKIGFEEEEWDKMTTEDRNRFEMRALLEEENFKINTTPVEFVGYSERLYQTLVDIGAAKVTKTQTGQVAIDAEGLGYPDGLLQ